MVVDTSALVAIVLNEPEQEALARALRDDPIRLMSAASYVEAVEVYIEHFGLGALGLLDDDLAGFNIRVMPVTVEQARRAGLARLCFGKRRHPAQLNYGDCFTYALAQSTGEPLLFKGEDFAHTDVVRVPLPPR